MTEKIFCVTSDKGRQSFYICKDGRTYYLFTQSYKVSVKEYFSRGVTFDKATDFSSARGKALRHTLEKIKIYVVYIEKEYGINIRRKTADKKGKAVYLKHKKENGFFEEVCYGDI